MFPIHKCGYFSKVKEIKRLRAGVASYAAQATAPIDAEIGKIDQLWMEASYIIEFVNEIHLFMVDGMGSTYHGMVWPQTASALGI